MYGFKGFVCAGLLAVFASTAGAATVSVNIYDPNNPLTSYNVLTAGWKSTTQDFEALGKTLGEHEYPVLATNVGTFQTVGGTGTGGTVTDKKGNFVPGNTGHNIALRNDKVYGRKNFAPAGGNWFLDSNDTFGMIWDVAVKGKVFDKLIFALTDATDQGAYLRISVDGAVKQIMHDLTNGQTTLVTVNFGEFVKSATIELVDYKAKTCIPTKTKSKIEKRTVTVLTCPDPMVANDGFSIDGVKVSAVPLPAGIVLLGSALVGFGVMSRRRAKTA